MLLALSAIFFEVFLWTLKSGRPWLSWPCLVLSIVTLYVHFCKPFHRSRLTRPHNPIKQRRKSSLLR